MMENGNDRLNPASVDEEIEQLLHSQQQGISSDERLVRALRDVCEEDDMLERVWVRLDSQGEKAQRFEPGARGNTPQRRKRDMNDRISPRSRFMRRLVLIAAVLFVAVFVGGMALILNIVRPNNGTAGTTGVKPATPVPTIVTPSGIYICDEKGIFRASTRNGKTEWSYALPVDKGGSFYCRNIVMFGGKLYAAIGGGIPAKAGVLVLDPNNGKEIWMHSFDNAIVGIGKVAIYDGVIYASSYLSDYGKGKIYKLNIANGEELKQYQVPSGDFTVVGQVMYVGAAGGPSAYDLNDGKLLWHTAVGQLAFGNVSVVDGILYTQASKMNKTGGLRSGQGYAFDAMTGKLKWQTPPVGDYVFDSTVANGVVYFGSQDTYLYAYNAKNGNLLWKHKVDGDMDRAPTVQGGTVYVSAYNGMGTFNGVMALDATDGHEKWQAHVDSGSFMQPVVANGVVYTSNGDTYAFKSDNGVPLWRVKVGNMQRMDMSVSMIVIP